MHISASEIVSNIDRCGCDWVRCPSVLSNDPRRSGARSTSAPSPRCAVGVRRRPTRRLRHLVGRAAAPPTSGREPRRRGDAGRGCALRRVRRPAPRLGAIAAVLVGALAVGWIATSRGARAHGPRSARRRRRPHRRDGRPARSHRRRPIRAHAARARSARRAQCGTGRGRAARRAARSAGVDVDYRLLGRDAVRAAYLARSAAARRRPTAPGPGSGPPGVRTRRRGRTVVVAAGGAAPRGRALRLPDRAGPGRDVVDGRRPRACSRTRSRPTPTSRRCSRGGSRTPSVDASRRAFPDRARQTLVRSARLGRRTRECRWRSSARTDSGARSSPPT